MFVVNEKNNDTKVTSKTYTIPCDGTIYPIVSSSKYADNKKWGSITSEGICTGLNMNSQELAITNNGTSVGTICATNKYEDSIYYENYFCTNPFKVKKGSLVINFSSAIVSIHFVFVPDK